MDLRQLAVLVAVADQGSFSSAARALHTVQSNISAHVARLERELGAMLVDRTTGTLTEEGTAVVERARRVQAEMEALVADVAAIGHEVVGNVRLGVIGTTGRWLVPLLLDHLGREHPKVKIVVVDATTTSLLPQLAEGRLDLAVLNLPISDPDIEVDPLFEEDRVLVAPADHPLAGRDHVMLADLADHELLLEPRGTAFRDELDDEAEREGVELRAQAEVDGMRLVASLATEGYGAAILPATALPPGFHGPWTRAVVDGMAPRSVGLARRRRGLLSAPARALRDVLLEVVAEVVPDLPQVRLRLADPAKR
jgi:LysR family hydrogen peroxide-inducible transcriptional activator